MGSFMDDKDLLKGYSASTSYGIVCALIAVVIWGGWIVYTRHSVTSYLYPLDVGLLRFGTPAVLLAPIWFRLGLIPTGIPKRVLLPLLAGSGAFFSLSISNGMTFAPASHAGALVPGTIPLWAAVIGYIIFRERFNRIRILGFIAMFLGVLLLGGASVVFDTFTDGAWRGHLLFLFSAFMWACYAHAFIRSGLTPIQAVALSSLWSALIHGALAIVFGSSLPSMQTDLLLWQIFVQGFLSGILAFIAFSIAVKRLGPTRAAGFTSLVPAIAALGGWFVIGEPLSATTIVAIVFITFGVAIASGFLSRKVK
jgi:drug/metabolite transporter (DMT)-like permease|tara:strand:- start:816 stop:1745 length:930 start_codon:yes stop_codon:yes gene_type:complete